MTTLDQITEFLATILPLQFAEDWDNVGLLLGQRQREISKLMTCLTISDETISEAIRERADMIVSHHPFPFHAAKKWTSDTIDGKRLLRLLEAKIAVYSPHTAHDSGEWGINQQLAELLNLEKIRTLYPVTSPALLPLSSADSDFLTEPLTETNRDVFPFPTQSPHITNSAAASDFNQRTLPPWKDDSTPRPSPGTGRLGRLSHPVSLLDFAKLVQKTLNLPHLQWVGQDDWLVETVAIGCGAAGSFLPQVLQEKADVFLLGETHFHTYLEALDNHVGLVLPGHFATEQFAMKTLAQRLAHQFPSLNVWASQDETDPVHFL